jgi:four helix bundle protein
MERENIIAIKTFNFSIAIIKLYKIHVEAKEYVLSKQLLRSATSIGANVEEAAAALTKKEFIAKMSIASKEARETKYWLRLLNESKLIDFDYQLYLEDIQVIISILTKIIKTSQASIEK